MLAPFSPSHRYHRQISLAASLIFASALCAVLLALRIAYTRGLVYTNLAWNLFLAWLPVISSFAAYNLYRRGLSFCTLLVAGSAFIWLLFFPNAPYLLTDILHLKPSNVPLWYDLILLVAFAWTGTFLGLVSLYMMQTVVYRMTGALASWLFAVGTLAAGSFGIYLGRFLRWNSWDIFTNPGMIWRDILERLRSPWAHPQTFAFSALFFLFLVSAYWMLVAIVQLGRHDESHHAEA
jgi:uncharacterized membrane protein